MLTKYLEASGQGPTWTTARAWGAVVTLSSPVTFFFPGYNEPGPDEPPTSMCFGLQRPLQPLRVSRGRGQGLRGKEER